MRYVTDVMEDVIPILEEEKVAHLMILDKLSKMYPQYISYLKRAEIVDSIGFEALKNNWDLYKLDTIFLSDENEYMVETMANELLVNMDTTFLEKDIHPIFFTTYRKAAIYEKQLLKIFYYRINAEGDAYVFFDKIPVLVSDNAPISCGKTIEMPIFLVDETYNWRKPRVTEAIWINNKPQELKNNRATFTFKPITKGWQYYTIKIKTKIANQTTKFVERRVYYYVE